MNKQELVEENEDLVSALEDVRADLDSLDPESASFEDDVEAIQSRIADILPDEDE